MTTTGVRQSIDELLGSVDEIMQRIVLTLSPDLPMGEAVHALERAGVSGAPVVDGDRVVGVVSLGDLFRAVGVDPRHAATSGPWHRYERFVSSSGRTVRFAMSTHVVSVAPGTPIGDVAALMRAEGINRVPVITTDGRLVGIVARDDVIRAVAEVARALHEQATLEVRTHESLIEPD
jgi:CBS domain-containing protein